MKKIQTLEMTGITKAFGGMYANKDIALCVNSGEVLGLLGENGAGKTTLMNILYGLYTPDGGRISINGEAVSIRSPRDSINLGIGMIHQHFMLVENHTVLENLLLGYRDAPMLFPHRYMRDRMEGFVQKYGISLDPDKKVWELSAGEQQKIEIVKALLLDADLLIMDEPTSVLTPSEAEELFNVIGRMRDEGHSVILISHKLDEIMSICNRVTVLRKGETVGDAVVRDVGKRDLARMMIGRDVVFSFNKTEIEPGEIVLEVEDLHVISDRNTEAVRGVSFHIRQNEILGIAGVSGNGQRELVEAITGLRKVRHGRIVLEGDEITNESAGVVNSRGITHVPEERIKFGIVPNLLIYENSVLKQHTMSPFSKILFLDYESIRDHAMELVDRYRVSAPSINVPMKNLSGGNIQKLIIGREIYRKPPLLVASHPTYGLDVGATEYIREQLLERRKEGGAVLLVSEDLEELFAVCDRIAVIFKGTFTGILSPGDSNIDDIGMMMTGAADESTGSEEA